MTILDSTDEETLKLNVSIIELVIVILQTHADCLHTILYVGFDYLGIPLHALCSNAFAQTRLAFRFRIILMSRGTVLGLPRLL